MAYTYFIDHNFAEVQNTDKYLMQKPFKLWWKCL